MLFIKKPLTFTSSMVSRTLIGLAACTLTLVTGFSNIFGAPIMPAGRFRVNLSFESVEEVSTSQSNGLLFKKSLQTLLDKVINFLLS